MKKQYNNFTASPSIRMVGRFLLENCVVSELLRYTNNDDDGNLNEIIMLGSSRLGKRRFQRQNMSHCLTMDFVFYAARHSKMLFC